MKALSLSVLALTITMASVAHADDTDQTLPGYSPPHVVPYQGGVIPPYAHLEDRPNKPLIQGGFGVAGSVYGLSVLYALGTCGAQMACREGSAWLYVPVVGPFVTATQAPTTGGQALSVFDGVLQVIGTVVAIAGLEMPRSVVVWQDRQDLAVRVKTDSVPGGVGIALSFEEPGKSAP
jgi:hypothetical protein